MDTRTGEPKNYSVIYADLVRHYPDIVGTARYCNICGYSFSTFVNANPKFPREGLCPVCHSLERHRHLWVHLLAIFPFLKGKRVLHIAPEEIIRSLFLGSGCDYHDLDLYRTDVRHQADITVLPFEDDYFDYIVAIHVLEHIPDDHKAMQELRRVLKTTGTAFLAVPLRNEPDTLEDPSITSEGGREKYFGQNDHVRYYGSGDFFRRLVKAGFQFSISTPDSFPDSMRRCKFKDKIALAQKVERSHQ